MSNQVRVVSLRLPADLLEKVDVARGDVNRNTYLVRLLESAHAPTLAQTLATGRTSFGELRDQLADKVGEERLQQNYEQAAAEHDEAARRLEAPVVVDATPEPAPYQKDAKQQVDAAHVPTSAETKRNVEPRTKKVQR
jgi:hypothetical protein